MGDNCTSFRRIWVHICIKAYYESDRRLERYYWIAQTTVYGQLIILESCPMVSVEDMKWCLTTKSWRVCLEYLGMTSPLSIYSYSQTPL